MDIIDVVNFIKESFDNKWLIEEDRKYHNNVCLSVILQFKPHKHSDNNILIEIHLSMNNKDLYSININGSSFDFDTKSSVYEDHIYLLNMFISNILSSIELNDINKEINRSFEDFDKSNYVKSIIRDNRIDRGLDIMGEE